jgi:hypothetical protein
MGLFDIFRKKKTMTLGEVVKKMKKEGYSDKEIKEKLMGEMTEKVLGGIGVSDERIEELKNEYKEEKDTPSVEGHSNVEFRWVIGKCDIDDDEREYILAECGKNFINKDGVCENCLSRKDEIDTMEYWKLVGLPQSGFSMCQYGCGCKLVEVKN